MSSIGLLLGLLVVAYVGSQLMGDKQAGYRLPSGAEYLLLGVALGPHALGVVERSTLSAFEPLAIVGTAWLTLVIGADYGFRDGKRVSLPGSVIGVVTSAVTIAAVAIGVQSLGARLEHHEGIDLRVVSMGIALVACETTRHAVRWVAMRYGAAGPLSELIADVAESDDLVPVLGIAAVFPLLGSKEAMIVVSPLTLCVATPLLGIVLGGTAAALLRAEPRAGDGWGVILGATFLGAGIAWRLGLAPQALTFALGASLAVFSRHREELRTMLLRTEQPVLLPLFVLAGATVHIGVLGDLAPLIAAAFVIRWLVRLGASFALARAAGAKNVRSVELSFGLLSTGALCITVGLAFAARFPGTSGNAVLVAAVALALLGEIFGPTALRRALVRTGEIVPVAPEPPATAETAETAS